MKPYYQHAGITIYHGDCRRILPALESRLAILGAVDFGGAVAITDPPYGVGLSNHAAGKERRAGSFEIAGDHSDELANWFLQVADKAELPIVVFASPWKQFKGDWRNLLVWDKGPAVGGGGDTATCMKRSWELIQTARTSVYGARDESILKYWVTPQDSKDHPAEKPLDLLVYLVGKFSKENDMILDPFCGTGSTLEAAKIQGRSAIGIEIEEKYCEIAAKRLSQEVFQFTEGRELSI